MDEHAVVVADTTGTITRWNAAAEELFGYDADDALGHSLDLIVPEHLRMAHRSFAGRLLVLSDALGTALGAMAIYTKEGTTGVQPFG
ncbi:MAG TPA: PAS domain S-box protein [Jiangellaceae bacterium]|nr:PAS domain S-box protein [Jiangellaceae bacterium]